MSKRGIYVSYWCVVGLLVAIDRITKLLAVKLLLLGSSWLVLPHVNLSLAHNAGSAFNFLAQAGGWQRYFFVAISILMSFVLSVWLYRSQRLGERWALSFILAGALGNLWDRVQYGTVIDFIDFYIGTWHFPTFNVADSVICVGIVLLFVYRERK